MNSGVHVYRRYGEPSRWTVVEPVKHLPQPYSYVTEIPAKLLKEKPKPRMEPLPRKNAYRCPRCGDRAYPDDLGDWCERCGVLEAMEVAR